MEKIVEVWKDIVGYEGVYSISNLGNVSRVYKNGKTKTLKPAVISSGYLAVVLCVCGKPKTNSIHSLLAKHFIPITDSVVNHKDGNKLNNSIDNLEWVSVRENTTHGNSNKLKSSKHTGVSWHKLRKKWHSYSSLNGIKKYLGYFDSEEEANTARIIFENYAGIKNIYA